MEHELQRAQQQAKHKEGVGSLSAYLVSHPEHLPISDQASKNKHLMKIILAACQLILLLNRNVFRSLIRLRTISIMYRAATHSALARHVGTASLLVTALRPSAARRPSSARSGDQGSGNAQAQPEYDGELPKVFTEGITSRSRGGAGFDISRERLQTRREQGPTEPLAVPRGTGDEKVTASDAYSDAVKALEELNKELEERQKLDKLQGDDGGHDVVDSSSDFPLG